MSNFIHKQKDQISCIQSPDIHKQLHSDLYKLEFCSYIKSSVYKQQIVFNKQRKIKISAQLKKVKTYQVPLLQNHLIESFIIIKILVLNRNIMNKKPKCIHLNESRLICMDQNCKVGNPFMCLSQQCYDRHQNCESKSDWNKFKNYLDQCKQDIGLGCTNIIENKIRRCIKNLEKQLVEFQIKKQLYWLPIEAQQLLNKIQTNKEIHCTGSQIFIINLNLNQNKDIFQQKKKYINCRIQLIEQTTQNLLQLIQSLNQYNQKHQIRQQTQYQNQKYVGTTPQNNKISALKKKSLKTIKILSYNKQTANKGSAILDKKQFDQILQEQKISENTSNKKQTKKNTVAKLPNEISLKIQDNYLSGLIRKLSIVDISPHHLELKCYQSFIQSYLIG